MNSSFFNRITRWLSSVIGMVFMGVGLLAAVWSGSDPMDLAHRVFWSGFIGFLIGMVAGKICTALLKERLGKETQPFPGAIQEGEEISETPPVKKRLEPWNPPRVEFKETKEG